MLKYHNTRNWNDFCRFCFHAATFSCSQAIVVANWHHVRCDIAEEMVSLRFQDLIRAITMLNGHAISIKPSSPIHYINNLSVRH